MRKNGAYLVDMCRKGLAKRYVMAMDLLKKILLRKYFKDHLSKALRKTELSNISVTKVQKFFRNIRSFQTRKNFAKIVWK
jgi:hypothetical protein